jgi:hypothetical protein
MQSQWFFRRDRNTYICGMVSSWGWMFPMMFQLLLNPKGWTFTAEYCKNQPEQHDGWNCGEYMYAFSKAIMKGQPSTQEFLPLSFALLLGIFAIDVPNP